MSKRPLFFRSVGRGPPPSLPSLWWKGPPERAPWFQRVTWGQHQWAVLPKAATENPNFAASATDRRALTCLHNYPKSWWQHTLMLHTTLGTNQAMWHGAARQEFRQQSAINPRPVINKLVLECGLPSCTVLTLTTLLPPRKAYRHRWKKNCSSLLYGMLLKQSRYTKDRPLSCATVMLFPPRHCHKSQVSTSVCPEHKGPWGFRVSGGWKGITVVSKTVLFSQLRLTERLHHPSLEVGTSSLLSVGLL